MLVVMDGVRVQDSFELAASEDEDAIEAVGADCAHPALGERVRVRRLQRRPGRLDAFRAEDFVEGAAELRVAAWISNPKLRRSSSTCMTRLRACCVTQTLSGWVWQRRTRLGASREEEEHVDPLQAERLDREEIARERTGVWGA